MLLNPKYLQAVSLSLSQLISFSPSKNDIDIAILTSILLTNPFFMLAHDKVDLLPFIITKINLLIFLNVPYPGKCINILVKAFLVEKEVRCLSC